VVLAICAVAVFYIPKVINQVSAGVALEQGKAFYEKGDVENAITNFDKAIKLNPNFTEAYTYRGFAYGQQGAYLLAIDDFDRALQLKPDYADAYLGRGIAYYYQGDLEQAIRQYDKALEIEPNSILC
jgi:tetratricopeptide (TPR) repeat protein